MDDFEVFQQQGPGADERVDDVIAFWTANKMDPCWEDPARIPLEFLANPAMSAEPERVFSGAKITITDRRCSLGDENINALECLRAGKEMV